MTAAIGTVAGQTGAGGKQAGEDEREEEGFHGWFSPLVALGVWAAGAGGVDEVVAWVGVADGGLSGFAALASVAGFAAAFVSVAAAGAAALLSVAAGAVAVLRVAVAAFSVAGVVAVFLAASALGAVFFSVAVVTAAFVPEVDAAVRAVAVAGVAVLLRLAVFSPVLTGSNAGVVPVADLRAFLPAVALPDFSASVPGETVFRSARRVVAGRSALASRTDLRGGGVLKVAAAVPPGVRRRNCR